VGSYLAAAQFALLRPVQGTERVAAVHFMPIASTHLGDGAAPSSMRALSPLSTGLERSWPMRFDL
jgi:hypothetical protein